MGIKLLLCTMKKQSSAGDLQLKQWDRLTTASETGPRIRA
uniref:Uncharacterized protein n=1 Tax=Anguilla anguilla TaxID=7936 RepID=A0A0E9SXQ8_ANGAN